MKKIALAVAAAAIVLPMSAFAVIDDGYEYITSPDRIPLYKQIRKEGMKLYGVLKEDKELPSGQEDNPGNKLGLDSERKEEHMQEKNKNWEKIPHPDMIKNYEGVRPVGNALWGYRKSRETFGFKNINEENAACIVTALTNRDALIAEALAARSSVEVAALNARTNCMTSALNALGENLSDDLGACNETYADAREAAKSAYDDTQESAWNAYRESLKTCAAIGSPSDEDEDDETADEVEELDDDSADDEPNSDSNES